MAGEQAGARRAKMFGKVLQHLGRGIEVTRLGVARIEKGGVDLHAVPQQRIDRIGIQAALQLLAALQDHRLGRHPTALIVNHACLGGVARQIETIDEARDTEACVGDGDGRRRIPGDCGVGFGRLSAERYFCISFLTHERRFEMQ